MYESFFNLSSKPFELLPNPDFLFLSRSHKRALTYLDYGIRERAGFILLTGEIGSGKTTIVRDLIKKKDSRVLLSKIFNTRVESEQLISMINDDFGLPTKEKDKITLLRDLNNFLIDQYADGNQPILIIDEAQNLSLELLEEIRMLSNLETDNAKLLQIILVGQPELRKALSSPNMLQLRQRISINCHLQPLSRPETEQYILHRMEIAGNREAVLFTAEALDIVFKYSRGIPRLINIICDFLMLSAFAEETKEVCGIMVRDIIGDLDFEMQYWGTEAPGKVIIDAEGKTVAVPAGAVSDSEITGLLKDVCFRLNKIEEKYIAYSQTSIGQLKEQLSSLENALTLHVIETVATVCEQSRRVEQVNNQGEDVPLALDEDKSCKAGFIRRILG